MIAAAAPPPLDGRALRKALLALHAATMAIFSADGPEALREECVALRAFADTLTTHPQPIGADMTLRLMRMADLVRICALSRPDPDPKLLKAFQSALMSAVAENNAIIDAQRRG